MQFDGLNGAGGESRKNATDEVIDSALRYRVQAPIVDGLLADLGIEGGKLSQMGGLIREARDLQSIGKESERSKPPATQAERAPEPSGSDSPRRGRRRSSGSSD